MKSPEACYCCRGYDRPCLQNNSTKGVPLYKPDLRENPQSPSVLPPIAPKEVNNHLMVIPAQANKPPKMDLSDWEVTCTEFHPRKWNHASEPITPKLTQYFLPPQDYGKRRLSALIVANPGILLDTAVFLANHRCMSKVSTPISHSTISRNKFIGLPTH